MSEENGLIEVEHDNMMLSKELIEVYKKRISDLEAENIELRARLKNSPVYVIPIPNPNKPRVRTTSELKTLLETRSIPKVGE